MILIAGPCVIENKEILYKTANFLQPFVEKFDFYFKSSCVKDNRTVTKNYGGVGFIDGLNWLQEVREKFGFKITTDFHSPREIEAFGKVVDLIQIPAFLAMQTSMAESAVKTKKPIHIKKPQFLGPMEAVKMVKKYQSLGAKNIIITDRGTQLGYNQVFMDPRHIPILKEANEKVCIDITHPNKNYPGDKFENSLALVLAGIGNEVDGFFMEIHPNPDMALCDGSTMLTFKQAMYIIRLLESVS